jgi:hypothetical protein
MENEKKKEFDPDLYQGRREEQVKSNETLTFYAMLGAIIVICVYYIAEFLNAIL